MLNPENFHQFIGNLGGDPELQYLPSGTAVAKFSLAVNEARKNAEGEYVDETTWARLTVFGKQAETAKRILAKGAKIVALCRFQTREWEDKTSGEKRYGYDFVVNNFRVLQWPKDGVRQADSGSTGDDDVEEMPF